jgi:hypothetical protein
VLTVGALIEELQKQDAHKLVKIPAVVVYGELMADELSELEKESFDAPVDFVRNEGAYVLLRPEG